MSDRYLRSDLLYARYRGEHAPIPQAETLDMLGEIIELRVKPGLTKLLGRTGVRPVEYAGYALTTFRTPLEMMELFSVLGGKETMDALKSTGLKVDTEKVRDDFWVERSDIFDRMQKPLTDAVWPQGQDDATGLSGLNGVNFLLGPVVRGPIQVLGGADNFNQNEDTDFAHDASVYVTGQLLMSGLYEHEPKLREGWAVSPKTIASFFIEKFDMQDDGFIDRI